MNSLSLKSADQTPTALTLVADGGLTVQLSDLMRLKLLRQASSSVQLLYLQHLFATCASTFEKRIVSAAQFESLQHKYQHKHSQCWWEDEMDEATVSAALVWCLTARGSVVLLRQTETEWLVLSFGDKNALSSAALLFECLLYDLHPGLLQVREVTMSSDTIDASLLGLAAAQFLLPVLKTQGDLRQLPSFTPLEDCEALIEDVIEVIQVASGVSVQTLNDLVKNSERFMAQKYLEVAFGSVSQSSSLKASVCSRCQSFVMDNGHILTSTDVTSHRLSSIDSSEPLSRLEDAPPLPPQVLPDSLEEDVSEAEEVRIMTSPQAANTGPLFSWTFVPPTNRVPENETMEGTTEESESRSELVFIEYSHQSPRNAAMPRLTMSEIFEDEEEGRSQLDPRFFEGLAMEEYGAGFLSTTPKFRVLPALLDFEEPKKRPPSFSSCDFTSVALESPYMSAAKGSPECSSEVEVENTMGKVFLEPQRNRLPHSLGQKQAFPGRTDSVKTCGATCALLCAI